MNFEVIIGIEVHCELKTKSKMYSSSPVTFGESPNSAVQLTDFGFPGTLPVVNKEAVRLGIIASHLLNCEIDTLVRFDRKSYYYADLPKGFQITQQFFPLGKNGYIQLSDKKARINRLHMEEDTAKQFHEEHYTYIDYNRSSNPLIEIVSEPDLRGVKDVVEYIETLRRLLEYGEVSNVKMEEGSMRCDVNISLRPYGYKGFGTKVEVKNINSLNNISQAIEYEIKRQEELLLKGEVINQETRRFDETTKTTVLMRTKSDAIGYRYMVEPNIVPIRVSDEILNSIIESIPERADDRYKRYLSIGLSEYDAEVLINNKSLSDFFDQVTVFNTEYKLIANWIISDLQGYLNKNGVSVKDTKLKPVYLADLIELITSDKLSSKQARTIFDDVVEGSDPKILIEERGLVQNSDEQQILTLVKDTIEANPQAIDDYINGKDRAIGFIVGQIMKSTGGKVNPGLTNKLVRQELDKYRQ